MTAVLFERDPVAAETGWTIPGDPSAMAELGARLERLVQALEDCAAQVEGARAGLGTWIGQGAAGYERMDLAQRPKWKVAAESFTVASTAVADYARDLSAAQDRAAQARALYEQGVAESEAWAASLAAARAANPHGVVAAGPDPGVQEQAAALAMLEAARADLDAAARRLAGRLAAAEEAAPTRPGIWDRLIGAVNFDFRADEDFSLGIVIGITSLAKTAAQAAHAAWSLSPGRLEADPAGWRRSVKADFTGAVALAGAVARDPLGVGKQVGEELINAKTWTTNPTEAAGELVPQLASMLDGEGEEAAAIQATEDATSAIRAGEAGAAGSAGLGPGTELPSWLPENARRVIEHFDQTGSRQAGYKEEEPFKNDGRDGGEVLPAATASGGRISYTEWDLNPRQPGTNRGSERVVLGSDGSAYYTDNHYRSFRRIR